MNISRIAVVTGGSQGIGEAIAIRLHNDGYKVIVFDLKEPRELLKTGVISNYYKTDVTSSDNIKKSVCSLEKEYGAIDVLCNNAGVSTMQRVIELSEAEWDLNFSVNTKGVFLATQSVLPTMIDCGKGNIINVASMAALKGVPLLSHYAASKWAVVGFTKSVALEVASSGIRINAVCPGFVKTSMQERELVWEANLRGLTPMSVYEEYVSLTPMNRIEEPEDVANVVSFLASDDSSFITGEAICVTGGASL